VAGGAARPSAARSGENKLKADRWPVNGPIHRLFNPAPPEGRLSGERCF